MDDILIEESFANPDVKLGGKFAFWEEVDGLPRVANCKTVANEHPRFNEAI
ncbi:hypothetical protein L0337_01060 [candidate division KSB1 bacterium]|nr:hypothetical protein [candidate division KSB1 bacterium]